MQYCPNCGETIKVGDEYCPRCGVKISSDIHQFVCPRCGEALNDNERFCHRCGLSLVEGYSESEPEKKKNSALSFLVGLFIICGLLVAAYYVIFQTPIASVINVVDEHITFVKNGTPELYPDITYDEAFSSFFSNRSWSYFVSDTGKDVVEFKGDCMYHDTQVTATIQFVLDMEEGTFELEYLGFNDVPQSVLITYALITKVFEEYN